MLQAAGQFPFAASTPRLFVLGVDSMGCSSSAQTQPQDSNRPGSKQQERNGASKCDVNGPITNEGETIPDQSQLLEPRPADTSPDEVVTSEPSPSEDGVHLATATEDSSIPAASEESEIPAAPVELTTLSDAEDNGEAQPSEEQIEGDTGERAEVETAVEAKVEEEREVEASEDVLASGTTELKSENMED